MTEHEPPSPESYGFVLDEDSSDLTDGEVASAAVTRGPEDLTALLSGARCKHEGCGETLRPTNFTLRRRKPHLYSRITAACGAGHSENLVIQTTWVNP